MGIVVVMKSILFSALVKMYTIQNAVATSDEKLNFGMVPNLMELGIYIEGQLAPSHLGSLVHLHLLEKLKFEVGRVDDFSLPTECCYCSLVTSAMQISSAKRRALKGKADCPLRVRKVGTKVECPIIGRFEEEMLKAEKSVMKYVKKLFW
nr:disease resistance protein RPH8A-like isoform X4 [Ipomoea trifida]